MTIRPSFHRMENSLPLDLRTETRGQTGRSPPFYRETRRNAGTDGTFPSLLPGNAGETWEKPGKPGGNLGTGNLGTDRKPGRNLGTDRPFSRLICDVAAVQCY